jgi:hypothetical protein
MTWCDAIQSITVAKVGEESRRLNGQGGIFAIEACPTDDSSNWNIGKG